MAGADDTTILTRADDAAWRRAPDRVLVQHIDTTVRDELFGLAAMIWIALDEPRSIIALADELHDLAAIDHADTRRVVDDLVGRGHLTRCETGDDPTKGGVEETPS